MKNNSGFIALISAIIISAVLLLVVVNGSFSNFYSRSNILDFELKQKSSALAEACVDSAVLKLANSPVYTGNETISVSGNDTCFIGAINPSADPIAIFTKASVQNRVTNLDIKVKKSDLSIISWEEI
ncbi:MAG TPA: hypothetical protein VGO63_00555 [Candidatus Paceibacterota bacterium]|jgi:hypothetical protein|nr:hypothetical protein [Candidatus Paceibacterota bacterium]